jgi:DNA-binding GntR family transcriptional regulator
MNTDASIPGQILTLIRSEKWPPGSHLKAQMLADRLRVSRSPINDALQFLEQKGVLSRKANRGYFLRLDLEDLTSTELQEIDPSEENLSSATYFRIAEDRLNGLLPDSISERALRQRYQLTGAQCNTVLGRISNEGWAERKPGYGWSFSAMLTTPDSLLQSYRLRLALEPAALLEPGYRLDPQVLERCRDAEHHLLQGGILTDTADQLHDRGVRFHEALVEASDNAFFIDAIRRVNRVRRLLSYRSMKDRSRYEEHCQQHLLILDLIERGKLKEASNALREHLSSTLRNLARISDVLHAASPILNKHTVIQERKSLT